jgi:hypothetical protein
VLAIEPFLTAYDPSDLPGGSIDPLGFERGYLLLAEKLLPGLTNVASRPRYFTVLCAAIAISDGRTTRIDAETPRTRTQRRLDAIQRAERFWSLGSLLATRKDDSLPTSGLRGIRYVEQALRRIDERGDTSTAADFRLLSRQVPYGMVGIYGSVADELGLIDRATLTLGADLGRRLAEAFVAETKMPDSLKRAVAEGGDVGLTPLAAWGASAHVNAPPAAEEGRVLRETLVASEVRARTAALLGAHPPQEDEEELARLARVLRALATTDADADLRETLRAIVAYEASYRLVLLGFQRLLWSCQTQEPFTIELATTTKDKVLASALATLPEAVAALEDALVEGQTRAFCVSLERLSDVRGFLQGIVAARSVPQLVERLLARHREVQRAKVAGGRAKMPWLEIREGRVALTLSSGMRMLRPPERSQDVLAHPYRTAAVDSFLLAGGAS